MKNLRNLLAAMFAALTLLVSFAASPSQAWWGGGHMAIAIVAYREMKPETRAAVDALIQVHPDVNEWAKELPAGITDAQRRCYLFAIAATWPDRIKSSKDKSLTVHFYGGRDQPDPLPTDPRFPDLAQHQNWHYVDFPIDADGKAHEVPAGANALTQIPICAAKLSDAASSPTFRVYYLAWLEHLVGDIHQPLHAAGRFSATYPDGDQGGNAVKFLHPGKSDPNNLHGYWDSLLGDGGGGPGDIGYPTDWTAVEAVVSAITTEAPRLLAGFGTDVRDDLKPDDWTRESYAIDEDFVYTVNPDGQGPLAQPDAAYHTAALQLAHQRGALAGHRLALLLDGILSKSPTAK